ncbi:unnamed protein product [Ixodes pacificus]
MYYPGKRTIPTHHFQAQKKKKKIKIEQRLIQRFTCRKRLSASAGECLDLSRRKAPSPTRLALSRRHRRTKRKRRRLGQNAKPKLPKKAANAKKETEKCQICSFTTTALPLLLPCTS